MLIHDLSAAECAGFVAGATVGRLACAHDGQPYVVPIHVAFDAEQECLLAFSAIGKKVEWMRRNPKVCVEFDDVTDKDHWTSVLVFGHYEEISRDARHAQIRARAQALLQQRHEWWLPAAATAPSHPHQDVVLYRILIDHMTGRRASRDRT